MRSDITSMLGRLTPVRAGQSPEEVLTAQRINDLQDSIRALASGCGIRAGSNVRLRTGPSWVMISADATKGSGSQSPPKTKPWEVQGNTTGAAVESSDAGLALDGESQTGSLQEGSLNSGNKVGGEEAEETSGTTESFIRVRRGIIAEDFDAFTAIGFAKEPFSAPPAGSKIFMEISFTQEGDIDTAGIKYATPENLGSSDSWRDFPKEIQFNTDNVNFPWQEKLCKLIASVVENTEENPSTAEGLDIGQTRIVQVLDTNLLLIDWVYNLVPVKITIPWNGRDAL